MTLESVALFWEWVRQETDLRGWSIRELERRSELSRGRVSNAANLARAPTLETLEGLSRALGISLIEIQRRAGYLPPAPSNARLEEFREVAEILANLPDGPIRSEAMAAIRAIAESARRRALEDQTVEA